MTRNQTPKTPVNLIYGVNDRPPLISLIILGIEHGALLISSLMATIVFAQSLGATLSQTNSLVSVGLIAGGLACILQATRKWGLGSGYFCLHTSSFIYFHASVAAAQTGGLALVFGMTAVAGIMQTLLSRVMRRLRTLFPPEVAGIVVAMVGLALAPYAVKSLFGLSSDDVQVELNEVLVGVGTLTIIVGMTVWAKKALKLYAILLGIIFGYVSAYVLGVLPMDVLSDVRELPFVALPQLEHPGFAFDIRFLLPFFIAALCSSLKLTGDIISCQKINDSDWKRVDMASVQRGIVAEGLGTTAAGLLGGTGLSASSSNIGMSYATGATSRYIGYVTGVFFITLAFFPQPAYILSNMPVPVVGGIVVYASCFMIVTGWSIVMSRLIDSRKTFIVGISLIMGMSALVVPEIYDTVPEQFKPVFGSSIALTAVTGVLLNQLFRIGISSRATLTMDTAFLNGRRVHDFFMEQGSRWGARPDVIHKASAAASELYETLTGLDLARGNVRLDAVFDELNLVVSFEYAGEKLAITHQRPSPDELLEDDQALSRFSCFLITQYADKIKLESVQDKHRIHMVFEH